MDPAEPESDLGFGSAPPLAFLLPSPSPAHRRLSSSFTVPSRPLPLPLHRKRLAYVSLQGRLVGAEEATSARAVGVFGREEIAAWQLFTPVQRVVLVAVIGVAVAESRKNRVISRLRKSVEVRDQIFSSMQQKLDSLCEQLENAKEKSGNGGEVSPSKDAGFSLDANFESEGINFVGCGCWLCDQHQNLLDGPENNAVTRRSSGYSLPQGKLTVMDEAEPEERRMSDLSDWASSVTSAADIQMNAFAMDQDISNLKQECEEKDATTRELNEFLYSSDIAGSKRIAELEDIVRRKTMLISKLKKDMAILKQKVVQLTRLRRPSTRKEQEEDGDSKRFPFMAENVLYDMDSTSSSSSSSDSDCSPGSRSPNQTRTEARATRTARLRGRLMEKFLVPVEPPVDPPKHLKKRCRRGRCMIELDGRLGRRYRHDMASLLMQSYSEIGAFPHDYHIDGVSCATHDERIIFTPTRDYPSYGISGLDFDNKGYYLASVTQKGCLTIHDFEAMYCQSINSPSMSLSPCRCLSQNEHGSGDVEATNVMHLHLKDRLDVVRWNTANQDEVACASIRRRDVLIFDIGYVSSEPVEVLSAKHSFTIHDLGKKILLVFAAGTNGTISVWDRRASVFPCLHLMTFSLDSLNSIQLNIDNQTILGASVSGIIYIWDIRGGRTSVGFQSGGETSISPFTALKLASKLEQVESLKAQSEIAPSGVHWIGLDPSCPYQLAFHLDEGWSGVLNLHNLSVTHLHCPLPAWLSDVPSPDFLNDRRISSWLPTCSIYAVGSATESGIYLLDYFPDATSPSHVDYDEDTSCSTGRKQNRFIPLSEDVITCAAHPLNETIVVGTKNASLLLLSQKRSVDKDNGGQEPEKME